MDFTCDSGMHGTGHTLGEFRFGIPAGKQVHMIKSCSWICKLLVVPSMNVSSWISHGRKLGRPVRDFTGAQAPVSLGGYGSVTFSILKDDVEEHRYSVGATDSNGDAMTTPHFFQPDMPAGDYLVVVSFTDPLGIFAPATLEVPFHLNAEAGALDYSANQIVTVNDAGIQLQTTLNQEEDETNGFLIDFSKMPMTNGAGI